MKKIILLTLLGLSPMLADAYDAEIDGIYYNFSGDEAKVTNQHNYTPDYSGVVVIPEFVTYNGKTFVVTGISDNAFYDCADMTSVVIPNSVTTIGSGAFDGCSGLASIILPESLTTIGEAAFELCSGLTSIIIPNGVTRICESAFVSCI